MTSTLRDLKDLIERIRQPIEDRKNKARIDAFEMNIPDKEFLLISDREIKLQQIRFLIDAGHTIDTAEAYTAIAPTFIDLCDIQNCEDLKDYFIKCFNGAGFTDRHPEHNYPVQPAK